ncbi:MAG: hypothetical protein ACI8RD_011378 [Bacillariaceae sp.]|jgi:hypothetical protein
MYGVVAAVKPGPFPDPAAVLAAAATESFCGGGGGGGGFDDIIIVRRDDAVIVTGNLIRHVTFPLTIGVDNVVDEI